MKQFPACTAIFAVLTLFSACKKVEKEPFWNDHKKFEFQRHSYVYRAGNQLETILLADYNEDRPNEANVGYFEGVIGGQISFSNTAPMENFIYTVKKEALVGSYAGSCINLSSGTIIANLEGRIQEVGAGQMFDSRRITSLSFNCKTYLPESMDFGVAQVDQPGKSTSMLITHDKDCLFTACVNGTTKQVNWNYNYSSNNIAITAGDQQFTGTIINDQFSTPTLKATDGSTYIIQFYGKQAQSCPCAMQFKLYKIELYKSPPTNPDFKLVIGDC
jgi:hypothetical protein